jgi:SAM-dependent methyltransferase
MKVLDWGVGNGHFSYFLVRSGYKTFGFSLENFPVGVELADAQYHFLQGSVKDPIRLPFKDDSFAAVSSVGVLEHVRHTGGNDEDSMKEITRILKPGGVFVCYHLPNRYSLIDALVRCFFPNKHFHRFRYTSCDIVALMKQAKLQLVEIKRYGILPRNIWINAPKFLKHSKILALVWNILDIFLAYPFRFLCQNYVFVVRKPVNL